MNNNSIIDAIINKANAMLQALDSIEIKGRANMSNLNYAAALLEEIVKISVDEINNLNNKLKMPIDADDGK